MWSSQPKRLRFTVWDLSACILVCAAALVMLFPVFFPKDTSTYLEVSVDGEISTYSLDGDQSFTLENNGFSLSVVIENGGVRVDDADCPDLICENTGKITASGQSIACLPARIVLTLKSEGGIFDAQAG